MKQRRLGMILLVLVFSATGAFGQKKDKEREKGQSPVRVPEEQVVDMGISEMLAAWQIGDIELLQKYHAEDVTVVSGAYEPPVVGWANYLQAYQRQRERMQQVWLDRRNTYVNVKGNIAWAAYQWDFAAMVDGKLTSARGHTTLVLEKRKDRWLIVHNHTSMIPEAQPSQPTPPAQPPKPKS